MLKANDINDGYVPRPGGYEGRKESCMIQEIIMQYAKALQTNDVRLARYIERELAMLGMDEMTLIFLTNKYLKEERS